MTRASATPVAAAGLVLTGCSAPAMTVATAEMRTTTAVTYYHATTSAGPSILTRNDGSVLDERRTEPFGAAVDAIDYTVDPHNALDKETDPATGWSDHGARWLAVDAARWLTPDPPAKAPDPTFMTRPWSLHPYQYVEQNPIRFWDPDGREPADVEARRTMLKEQPWIPYGMEVNMAPQEDLMRSKNLRFQVPLSNALYDTARHVVATVGFARELTPVTFGLPGIAFGTAARYVGGKVVDSVKSLIKPLPDHAWTGRPRQWVPNVDIPDQGETTPDRASRMDDPPPARSAPRPRPPAPPRPERPRELSCGDPEYATLGHPEVAR